MRVGSCRRGLLVGVPSGGSGVGGGRRPASGAPPQRSLARSETSTTSLDRLQATDWHVPASAIGVMQTLCGAATEGVEAEFSSPALLASCDTARGGSVADAIAQRQAWRATR